MIFTDYHTTFHDFRQLYNYMPAPRCLFLIQVKWKATKQPLGPVI